MAFVDAKNVHGEIQTVPEHFLSDFPDQFQPLDPEPKPSTTSAKAATSKES